MTRFEGEEVHNKDNGIKVGPDGQFTIIQTHLPNMYQWLVFWCHNLVMPVQVPAGTCLEGEFVKL